MDRQQHEFPDIPLIVTVPHQDDYEVEIVPVLLPMPRCICNTNKFTVIRSICNIGLFREDELNAKNLTRLIQTFKPKIELEVFYTEADLSQLKNEDDKLKLAYWNMEKWVIIFEGEYQNLLRGSSVTVQIDSFLGDPTLGWGR